MNFHIFDTKNVAMDLDARKIEFVQEFLRLENEETISLLEEVMKQHSSTLEPLSVVELNSRINKSEDDFKNGRYKTSTQIREKYK